MSHHEFHHRRRNRSEIDRKKLVFKQIAPSIAGKSCPICLNHIDYRRAAVITACTHAYCIDCIDKWRKLKRKCPLCNAQFDSWFFRFSFSSRSFSIQKLPPLVAEEKRIDGGDLLRVRSNRFVAGRVVSSREDLDIGNSRTRPLPRLRSFGNPRTAPPDIIKERILQWRRSIYEQHLQAVPCLNKKLQEQDIIKKQGVKERILQKIEPWIERELKAIISDPDPSILVHVTTSIYISAIERKQNHQGTLVGILEDNYLEALQPFLLERTSMFWHELRCFAESYVNMDTYDTVVRYVARVD
ncbi:LOW QUALITY PROTEIN: uncharacterized protein LOC108193812 [Daucus carota subsp. sativus]|uniref:LOW QUALITY PROTEIN: uncharacterized protein LOC108193812 n=1 Tax=Daucus carota subsp. sativus TaxID=79200 RepID=UPI0007EFF7A0|nr:PREDICTED: LOW QUALITY PROTEIN: E3 ubiquitin-protein ligase Topors [Daucus carota subsp. sativus]